MPETTQQTDLTAALREHPARSAMLRDDGRDGRGLLGLVGLRKALPIRKEVVSEAERTIRFLVSTATPDRDGDIVEPAGWELDQYRKNPVVLWAHDVFSLPVARAVEIATRDDALEAVARFTSAEENPRGAMVFKLYAGGFLSAVSAGFMPLEVAALTNDEGERVGFHIQRQELWEFSCVTIPSNPDALIAARSKGIDLAPWREWAEFELDRRSPRSTRIEPHYLALTGRGVVVRSGDVEIRATGTDATRAEALRVALADMATEYAPKSADAITDFPDAGDNEPVGFGASNYRRAPAGEAAALRTGSPTIWKMSDAPAMPDQMTPAAFREREAAAAKYVSEPGLAGAVACYRLRIVHAKGLEWMRATVAAERERIAEAAADAAVVEFDDAAGLIDLSEIRV